jgi:hypothetical protein
MDLNTTTTLNGWTCNCGVFVRFDEAHVCPLVQAVTSGGLPTCAGCGKPVGWGLNSVQCRCSPITFHAGQIACDTIPLDTPGILADIPAMRERAERVKARAAHKDLDGPTARLLARDVLSLIEALEELV